MSKPMDTSGTVLDVEYTGGYFWHQAPAMMNYIAAINGYAPRPLDRSFTYCELGCGKGATSTVLAALHPKGQFFTCDINPDHIRGARALAKAGGIANVKFLERDVAKMKAEKLPKLDFITLHGLWSWVSGEVRAQVCAFIKAKLKPGGLVMVSYNAMPGWSHIQPIRQMMHAYTDGMAGDSIEKARRAYAYVRFLADHKAGYFVSNPASVAHLDSIAGADVRYIVHDYMTPHGDAFYFREVAEAVQGAGLVFAGDLVPAGNYPALAVASQFRELISTAPSRVVLETHRDFLANTRFRVDLYAAQPDAGRSPPDALRSERLFFALLGDPQRLPLKGETGGISYNFEPFEKSVRAVHALVGEGVADWDAIERATAMEPKAASRLIQELVLARHLWPSAPGDTAADCGKLQAMLEADAKKEGKNSFLQLRPRAGSAEYVAVSAQAAASPGA